MSNTKEESGEELAEEGTGIIPYFGDISVALTWQFGGAQLQSVFFNL